MLIFHMKCHVASHIKEHARVSDIHFNNKLCSIDLYNNNYNSLYSNTAKLVGPILLYCTVWVIFVAWFSCFKKFCTQKSKNLYG